MPVISDIKYIFYEYRREIQFDYYLLPKSNTTKL